MPRWGFRVLSHTAFSGFHSQSELAHVLRQIYLPYHGSWATLHLQMRFISKMIKWVPWWLGSVWPEKKADLKGAPDLCNLIYAKNLCFLVSAGNAVRGVSQCQARNERAAWCSHGVSTIPNFQKMLSDCFQKPDHFSDLRNVKLMIAVLLP